MELNQMNEVREQNDLILFTNGVPTMTVVGA